MCSQHHAVHLVRRTCRTLLLIRMVTLCYRAERLALPADLILLVLLEDAELRRGQVTGFAEVPNLLLDKHETLKAEELVVLV